MNKCTYFERIGREFCIWSGSRILVEHARAGARYWAVDEALVVAAVLIGESTWAVSTAKCRMMKTTSAQSTRARSSERKNSCFGNMRYDGVLVAGFGSVPVAERGASGVLSFATE